MLAAFNRTSMSNIFQMKFYPGVRNNKAQDQLQNFIKDNKTMKHILFVVFLHKKHKPGMNKV